MQNKENVRWNIGFNVLFLLYDLLLGYYSPLLTLVSLPSRHITPYFLYIYYKCELCRKILLMLDLDSIKKKQFYNKKKSLTEPCCSWLVVLVGGRPLPPPTGLPTGAPRAVWTDRTQSYLKNQPRKDIYIL